jgi:resuscitation-promoting factor RpfB
MAIKPGYLLLAGGGAVVLWSGVKGHRWTTTLRDLVSGQKPTGNELAITTSPSAYGYGTGVAPSASQTGVGGTAAKNMAIGRVLAAAYGWATGPEWDALVALWNQESSWSNTARNPSSGAYGIPQALPANKMPVLALPPVNSATAQIGWGLSYIKQRYGDPVAAEAHEKANNWY